MEIDDLDKIVEIIKGRLYFLVTKNLHQSKFAHNTICFSIDQELLYQNYAFDFGPLNVSCLHKYCSKLGRLLHNFGGKKKIVHYTSHNVEKKVNAAFLIGAFSVIYLKYPPYEVYRILSIFEPYKGYVDALKNPNPNFIIKLIDCLQAIGKAAIFNFFNFADFNVTEYDLFENPKFGNLNWVVPRKFVAFAGPRSSGHRPVFYLEYFLQNDVKTVIRLNEKLYDATVFARNGIEHFDLFFDDGSAPPNDLLLRFFHITETAPAAIAIHCKAGLGRTGTLICCYLIKHYGMAAKEAIAWVRICRPGSVIAAQQKWLEENEGWLKRTGGEYRFQNFGDTNRIPRHKFGIYSLQWPNLRKKLINQAKRKILNEFFSLQSKQKHYYQQ